MALPKPLYELGVRYDPIFRTIDVPDGKGNLCRYYNAPPEQIERALQEAVDRDRLMMAFTRALGEPIHVEGRPDPATSGPGVGPPSPPRRD